MARMAVSTTDQEAISAPTRLLLIDGHGLVFRAYHALPEMTNRRGEAIRVAYGYTSMLLLALTGRFDCAVAAFDPPGPTFRDHKLATYKATREPIPEEISVQVPVCQRITRALNIPVVVVPGFEADDVLGTLSAQASQAGVETVILSVDLDLLQLVDERTVVQITRRSEESVTYDLEAVRQRFGFAPQRIIDFKALRGDASDNIPGVPGVGEKTACTLLQRHGDLEGVLAAVDSMPAGRLRTNLAEHAFSARQGRELVTIVRDVPGVELELDACRINRYDREGAARLLEELGIPSLVRRLPWPAQESQLAPALPAAEVTVVDTPGGVAELVAQLRHQHEPVCIRAAFDEPARHGRILGLALSVGAERAWYVPIGADGLGWAALGDLAELLADAEVAKAGYQLKDELLALHGSGQELRGITFDSVLAAYLADSRGRNPTLAALTREWGGPPAPDPELLLGRGVSRQQPSVLSRDQLSQLFGQEAACLAGVRPGLQGRLDELGAESLLREVELPVERVLADMEATGVRLDRQQMEVMSVEMSQQIADLEAEMYRLAGRQFAPGSAIQLATLLYDELGLKSSRRTKTGRSTDAQTLEALREEHPLVGLVLEWRQLTKLKSTYVDALPALVDPVDGRVHTSFNQAVAATGRLSSSDPNLQNIPIRTELGRRIRAAFVPADEGWVLISADYSQIELRVLAHLSGEPELLHAFANNQDIHTDTAARVFGVEPAAVNSEQRRMAKVVNFGILYGLSSFGLSRDLGIPTDVAEQFITRYFATYSRVREYLQQVREEARRQGYVSTILGRRRYLTDINSTNRQTREANERMAINMPIQGSAADIMKLGMIRTAAALQESGCRGRLLLQVHDELVFEAPPDQCEQVAGIAAKGMSEAISLSVPLVVDLKSGPNWRDLTRLLVAAA